MTPAQISVALFMQISVILVSCWLLERLMRRFGQPRVVAEMIAGILLGPSLLGLVAPQVETWLFPLASMSAIQVLSNVGLSLYMFTVGLEFRSDLVRRQFRQAFSISVVGILTPFLLAALLGFTVIRHDPYFVGEVSPLQRVLFLGACMAITAFPMLARIVKECSLTGTRLGTLVLSAGAVDDAAAWCFLSVVLATLNQDSSLAILAIGGGLVFSLFMIVSTPYWIRWLLPDPNDEAAGGGVTLGILLAILALCAWATDRIGIHSVFGSFLFGAVIPKGKAADSIHRAIEPLTSQLLIPLFFVYSGLNTRVGILTDPAILGGAALLVSASFFGKLVACGAAARFSRFSLADSVAIGALMNSRGMMELIILNIGLEKGIISTTFFTIMVLMAILTNLAATPLFRWTRKYEQKHLKEDAA